MVVMALDVDLLVSTSDSELVVMVFDTHPTVSTPGPEMSQINCIMIATVIEAFITITLPESISKNKHGTLKQG